MNECNSIEIDKTSLIGQTKYRLNEITKIENFNQEINQRKSCSKKLSKYVAAFDCIDKFLIVLSATSGEVSSISFISVAGASVEIANGSFALTSGTNQKLLSITRNKKKNITRFICWLKANSIALKL